MESAREKTPYGSTLNKNHKHSSIHSSGTTNVMNRNQSKWAYPALRAWQKHLGVSDARIDTMVIYARKHNVPKWAFARNNEKWLDLSNENEISFEIESYFKAHHPTLMSQVETNIRGLKQ